MDKSSVTRPSPPSTLAIVADEAFCAQAAAVLMCDEEPIGDTFIGEPVEEVLAMIRWALSHKDDEGFDTEGANRLGQEEGAWGVVNQATQVLPHKTEPQWEAGRGAGPVLVGEPTRTCCCPGSGSGQPQRERAVLRWPPRMWSCTTLPRAACFLFTR